MLQRKLIFRPTSYLTKSIAGWKRVLLFWLPLSLLYVIWLVFNQMANTNEDFLTQSRILHRLLTQRAEQHDALLASLLALEKSIPGASDELIGSFAQSVQAAYPQVVSIERYQRNANTWHAFATDKPLPIQTLLAVQADELPERLTIVIDDTGYRLLRSNEQNTIHQTSFALKISPPLMLSSNEEPSDLMTLTLTAEDGRVLWSRPALHTAWRWLTPLHFEKHLGSSLQPFLLTLEQPPLNPVLPWEELVKGLVILLFLSILIAWSLAEYRRRRLVQHQLLYAQTARLTAMGEVAAGIAHELNQPLTAILANTQAIQHWLEDDEPDLSQARTAAEKAAQQAKRAGDVLKRLREFISPKQSGEDHVVLNEVVEEALALLTEPLQLKQIHLDKQLAAELPPVAGNVVDFQQVVVNLLLNAADALENIQDKVRRIEIKTFCADKQVHLAIRDNGPGLSREVQDRLFEPFFTTKEGGMGLGLPICENIAQQAGGTLIAHNTQTGSGTLFTLSLPIHKIDSTFLDKQNE